MTERNLPPDFDDEEDDLDELLAAGDLDDLDDLEELEGLLAAGNLDALGAEYDDPIGAARRHLSVDQLLERLVRNDDSLLLQDLLVLSDLSRDEMERVERVWPQIALELRRRVVRDLVASSPDLIDLNLGRLLRVALRDADEEVRLGAVQGLWEDADPDLIGPMVQLLQQPGDENLRAAAATVLGGFVLAGELEELDAALAMRVEQALLEVLHDLEEPLQVRCRALESIAYSSEAGLRQLIQDAYYSPLEEMRLSSVRAMGRSADTRWRSMVRAELSSPEPAMRAEAARACGELEVKAALPRILQMVGDEELEVRVAAIEALGHLGGKEARALLRSITAEEGAEESPEAEAAEAALDEMLFWEEAGSAALLEELEDGEAVDADDDADEDDDDDDRTDLDDVDPWQHKPTQPWDDE